MLDWADTHFQVSPNIWLGSSSGSGWPLKDITVLCISYSCCVLRVTVLLEGEPSAQSEVLNALDWISWRLSQYFGALSFFFYSDESLSTCCWKQHHSTVLQPVHFNFGMVLCSAWFPLNMMLELRLIRPDNIISQSLRFFLGAFLLSVFSCVFTEERIESCHTAAIKPRSVECCSDVSSYVGFSHLHIWSWSSTRVTIRFFITTLTKALLHQLLSLARRPALGRILVVPNVYIMDNGGYTLLWNVNAAEFFWTLPLMCGLIQSCFWTLQAVLLTAGFGFCSDIHFQLLDFLLNHVRLSKSHPFNWICHKCSVCHLKRSNTYKQYECSWTKFQLSQIRVWILMQWNHLRFYL